MLDNTGYRPFQAFAVVPCGNEKLVVLYSFAKLSVIKKEGVVH